MVQTKEMERLAELVRVTNDVALENLSHYATEPAAIKLETPHPELAARLWRTQAMRIVDAGKSKYYEAAANLERARRCYVRAGLVAEWADAVRQIRADHYRKTAFMAAFASVAAGAGHQAPPSFLERAKDRWGRARGRPQMKNAKRDRELDELIDEITTDANGEAEQLWAFRQAFEDNVAVPCEASVVGTPVQVLRFDYAGNERRGLTAVCRGRMAQSMW